MENCIYNAPAMFSDKDRYEDPELIAEAETQSPDDVTIEDTEEMTKEKLRALREKLKACETEKMAHLEDLQRARADFLNSRRRLEEQLFRDRERAVDDILRELLALSDSFDTAMADTSLWEAIDERWRSGVEAINAKLHSVLKSYSVESIDPIGQPFNPGEHEAVSNQEVAEEAEDRVVKVLQKGYKRGPDILRPAKVVVGVRKK